MGHLPARLPAFARIADRQCAGCVAPVAGPAAVRILCLEGLSQLLQTVERIRLAYNPQLSILGVALTMFDRRNNLVVAGSGGCPRLPRHVGVRDGSAAQCAPVGSAEPWPSASADLRSRCPGSEAYPPGPRNHGALAGPRRRRHEEGDLAWARAERADWRSARGARRHLLAGGVKNIEIARIRPNPAQPRQMFDEDAMAELAASIAERGVLQPIIVRQVNDGMNWSPASAAGARLSALNSMKFRPDPRVRRGIPGGGGADRKRPARRI